MSACKCAVLGYGWNYGRIYRGVRGRRGGESGEDPGGNLNIKNELSSSRAKQEINEGIKTRRGRPH